MCSRRSRGAVRQGGTEAAVRARDGGYGIDRMQGGVAGWFKRRGTGDLSVRAPDRDPGEIPGRDPGAVERGRE